MKKNLYKLLEANEYPGRGIVLGRSAKGDKAVVAYWIMGRSENSRNRVFDLIEGGLRTVEAGRPAFDHLQCCAYPAQHHHCDQWRSDRHHL